MVRNILLLVLKVLCFECSVGGVSVGFQLCGGCALAAGCSLKEEEDGDGG